MSILNPRTGETVATETLTSMHLGLVPVPPDEVKVKWMLTSDAFPDAARGPDFTVIDGQEVVGRVYQIEDGPDRGLWFWTMTAGRSGPKPAHPTSGRAAERGKAGHCVVQAYRALLADPTPAKIAKHRLSAIARSRT